MLTNRTTTMIIFLTLVIYCSGVAQENGYFVYFNDKNGTPYSVNHPGEFLSSRAIARRQKQNIPIDASDLPVTPAYVTALTNLGIRVAHTSKWLNGAIVFSDDADLMASLTDYDYIRAVDLTQTQEPNKIMKFKEAYQDLKAASITNDYGYSYNQTVTVNGQFLHVKGFKGEGMHIAIIDAGFYGVDQLPCFNHLWINSQILGTRDFVNPTSNIFEEHRHGMQVLSIVSGIMEGELQGTATEAKYWLLRSEDDNSEYPIEADYWIRAAEFADSAGVDVINTSLGYSLFDDASLDYTYSQMDGSTRISQAAKLAASKGMIVVVSAGNEGNKSWRYITAPSDAEDILTVGAVTKDSIQAYFASVGPSADDRIKPDITAMGISCAMQSTNGEITFGNGTSFSSPVITGLSACLWQALPTLSAAEIVDLIKNSAHQMNAPDIYMGYGLPDFNLALETSINSPASMDQQTKWQIAPNPFSNEITLHTNDKVAAEIEVKLYDILGCLHYQATYKHAKDITITLQRSLRKGIYLLQIKENTNTSHFKLLKD
ncbi:T9SS C-terminal target domain-containing protein [Marinilabiliaceae bacterium JC017]|nr:T9SS C-terminal target domain-containing protein [Marinilabiliaceae bacterium JC017]